MGRESLTKAETEKLARFGAGMFDILFERFCEGDFEIELFDLIQLDGVEAGLVDVTEYDPEEHGDDSGLLEAGDKYYVISKLGRKALQHARNKP